MQNADLPSAVKPCCLVAQTQSRLSRDLCSPETSIVPAAIRLAWLLVRLNDVAFAYSQAVVEHISCGPLSTSPRFHYVIMI